LGTAKDLVVFLRRDVTPGQPGNDRAVLKRKLALPIGVDRDIVAQNCAKIVEVGCFMGHGDQPPVAVAGRNFDSEDRSRLLIGVFRFGGGEGDNAGHR